MNVLHSHRCFPWRFHIQLNRRIYNSTKPKYRYHIGLLLHCSYPNISQMYNRHQPRVVILPSRVSVFCHRTGYSPFSTVLMIAL